MVAAEGGKNYKFLPLLHAKVHETRCVRPLGFPNAIVAKANGFIHNSLLTN